MASEPTAAGKPVPGRALGSTRAHSQQLCVTRGGESLPQCGVVESTTTTAQTCTGQVWKGPQQQLMGSAWLGIPPRGSSSRVWTSGRQNNCAVTTAVMQTDSSRPANNTSQQEAPCSHISASSFSPPQLSCFVCRSSLRVCLISCRVSPQVPPTALLCLTQQQQRE